MRWEITLSKYISSKTPYVVAALLIAVLQIGDLLSTWWSLSIGGSELNPLSKLLIDYHLLVPLKLGLAGFIVWGAFNKAPKPLWSLCVLWFIAGLYTMVVTMNLIHVALRLWA